MPPAVSPELSRCVGAVALSFGVSLHAGLVHINVCQNPARIEVELNNFNGNQADWERQIHDIREILPIKLKGKCMVDETLVPRDPGSDSDSSCSPLRLVLIEESLDQVCACPHIVGFRLVVDEIVCAGDALGSGPSPLPSGSPALKSFPDLGHPSQGQEYRQAILRPLSTLAVSTCAVGSSLGRAIRLVLLASFRASTIVQIEIGTHGTLTGSIPPWISGRLLNMLGAHPWGRDVRASSVVYSAPDSKSLPLPRHTQPMVDSPNNATRTRTPFPGLPETGGDPTMGISVGHRPVEWQHAQSQLCVVTPYQPVYWIAGQPCLLLTARGPRCVPGVVCLFGRNGVAMLPRGNDEIGRLGGSASSSRVLAYNTLTLVVWFPSRHQVPRDSASICHVALQLLTAAANPPRHPGSTGPAEVLLARAAEQIRRNAAMQLGPQQPSVYCSRIYRSTPRSPFQNFTTMRDLMCLVPKKRKRIRRSGVE